ncbi:MAG: M14 family metallopeptidase, partial [Bacteroidota bacterium]
MKAQIPLLLILIWGIGIPTVFAQHALIRTAHPVPAKIAANLAIDHFLPTVQDSVDWVASRYEIAYLKSEGIGFRVLEEDMQSHYAQQLQSAQRSACGLQHYSTGSMGGYHTYQEVLNQLNLMHQLYPSLCGTPFSIGQSVEGNPIMAIKLSDQPHLNQSASEPRVYLDALTHAREPLSMESLLAFAWWLLESYGQDANATYLLEEREIYLLPVVNPDGYLYNQQIAPNGGGMWRKNRRFFGPNDCVGVDLNRNYPLAWADPNGASDQTCSETFRGASAISEPESQAVKTMIDSLGASAAMSVHSFGQVMIHPWLWQNTPADFGLSTELASDFIDPSFRAYGSGPQMLGYRASGTTSDYLQ